MATHTLNAKTRTERGKNASYRLRAAGDIPAIVYSHGEATSVKVNAKEFNGLFKGHISESFMIDLNIEGQDPCQVFVKDYQSNPITDVIEHLDFFKVTYGEEIQTMIPLRVIGTPVGVKKGGILEINEREIEVKVLPRDLPEELVIDVTSIEIDQSFHVSDIKGPASMSFIHPDDHVIAHVTGKVRDMEAESEEEVVAVEEESTEE